MREVEASAKVESTDQQLFGLNNELSRLEYEQDVGSDHVADRIDEVEETIRRMLSDPSLREAARICRSSARARCDHRLMRKAHLLEREIAYATVENHRALRAARRDARTALGAVDFRSGMATLMKDARRSRRHRALSEIAKGCAVVEPACREHVKVANQVSQGAGYEGYLQAKLHYEGTTLEQLLRLFRAWKDERLPRVRQAVAEMPEPAGGRLEPCDLLYTLDQIQADFHRFFPPEKKMDCLGRLFAGTGGDIRALPISFESRKLPFDGACYRVDPSKDIRILLNSDVRGIGSYYYLLHEFGHGLYYCYCPTGSELLIDGHLAREILADLWPQFLKDRRFLADILGLPCDAADRFVTARRTFEDMRLLIYIRDSVFALEVLQDPDTLFAQTWQNVNEEWLGIRDDSGAFDTFDFGHLLDMKSYVLAQVLSEEKFASLAPCGVETSGPRPLLEAIAEELYEPGNTIEWQAKFEV